ncbi:hypothetical protein COOONC_20535 [Cooperia oncophora]
MEAPGTAGAAAAAKPGGGPATGTAKPTGPTASCVGAKPSCGAPKSQVASSQPCKVAPSCAASAPPKPLPAIQSDTFSVYLLKKQCEFY